MNVSHGFIGRKITSSVLLILLGIIMLPPVFAQTADEDGDTIEEVAITGSRIRQDPLDKRLPVLTLSEEDYEASGASSLAEYIQRLPISGSAINATNNSSGNLGFPPDGGGIGAGAAEVDLRYLQSKRVLVLVDGRRWIKGSSGSGVSGAVDLNSIPVNAIKSIEILQDGASAIYGSDAIGGVLNIITQDDYESLKASAQYGQYAEGDGETAEYDVRFGASGDRGRALIDISYTDQKSVNTADRDESVYPLPGFPYGVSSGTPAGRFVFFDPSVGDVVSVAPDAGVANPVWDPTNPAGDNFHPFALADRFNYQPFNHLVTPNERLNLFAKGEYDLTDSIQFSILASFNNRKSQGQAAPVPLFWGPDSGSTPYMVNATWDKDQIYNPFGIDLGPDNLVFMSHRPVEQGPRIFNQDVDTWYLSSGVDGEFTAGGNDWYWDVNAVWSENSAKQTKLNQFNARSLSVALGDPAVCAATPGCVPVNIVGEGSLTPEMLDFVTYTGIDTSKQEMFDFTANIAGEAFELPAGFIGWAIGYEYRDEEGTFTPDPVVAAGETADVPTTPTVGSFDVNELYGEVVVPLLADQPGAETLGLSAAVRYSDYSLFESDTVYQFSINWAPVESIMLRASYAEGFRAPNIGELFNQGSRFDSGISDKCSNATPEFAANCAALGVPADYEQLNPQISVDTGGNINLTPETANTFTAGFTWDIPVDSMGGLEGFVAEFNYYDIEVEDAIQAPRAQDVLDGCIETLEDIFCDQVNRNASGTITSIQGVLLNIGGIETSGIDFNLNLTTSEGDYGYFQFQWLNTFLLSYDELIANSAGGFDKIAREGTELGSPTRGYPETKSSLNTTWFMNDWFVRLGFRYQSSLTEGCVGLVDANNFDQTQLCSDPPDFNELDSVIYTDMQVSWKPSSFNDGRWTFTAGVNNLFDEKPPVCFSCDLNSMDGTLYSIASPYWYLRAVFEM
ncbi:MAG TPA: TonB-dependent receptor [Xanthomonadales bacterium]|nr:TonB-dependent receptor [Xanthomonadales bacterium]